MSEQPSVNVSTPEAGDEDEPPSAAAASDAHAAAPSSDETTAAAGADAFDENVVRIVASKILNDWLRNRRQLLAPFALDLQKLGPREVDILIQAMISAIRADGAHEGHERERIDRALQTLNASPQQGACVERLLERPRALPEVLAGVQDTETGALVYAASLVAVDARKLVNRLYLRYLATRLQLPDDVVKTLQQRFRTAN